MNQMRRYQLLCLWCVGLLALVLAGCSSDDKATEVPAENLPTPGPTTVHTRDNPARVLVLHSYDAGYLWEQELNQGILAGLNEGGYSNAAGNLVIEHFWMDTKRNTSQEYFDDIAEQARQHILKRQPDVVIATDNNAIRLVVAPWPDESVSFVYAGLNDAPYTYGLENRRNITGVLERAHIVQTIEWIKLVLPEAERVTFLADDSITTAAYINEVSMQLDGSTLVTTAGVHVTNSYAEWQRIVQESQDASDVLLIGTYSTLRDASDRPVVSSMVMASTVNTSTIPVVPLWEFGVQEGALGGPVIAGQTQGHEAAIKAVQILNGTPAGDIPVTVPRRGKLTVNMVAANRWNIEFPLDLLEVSTIYSEGSVIQR